MRQSQLSGSQERLEIDEIWHLRPPSRENVGINAEEAWRILDEGSKDLGGNEVRVVLYDLGIEHQHPGLAGRIDIEASRDFDHTLNPGGLRPPAGRIEDKFDAHGTACAGLVCGGRDPARITEIKEEDKRFIGVAPMCQVVSVRISTNFELDSLVAALRYAKEAGDVILLPRALPQHEELTKLLKEVAAEVPVVCASGNDGTASLAYPASVENVIAVGACNDNGYRSTYSQYGEGLTLVAPSDDEQCEHEDLVRLAKEEAEQRVEEAGQAARETEHRAMLASEQAERASQQAEEARQRADQLSQQVRLALQQWEQASEAGQTSPQAQQASQQAKLASEQAEQASQRAEEAKQRADQAVQSAEQAWAGAEEAWLRVKLASLRAEAEDGPAEREQQWLQATLASLPEEQTSVRTKLIRRQARLKRRRAELEAQQQKSWGLHEAPATFEPQRPERLQKEVEWLQKEVEWLQNEVQRRRAERKLPRGEAEREARLRAQKAREQAETELKRRAIRQGSQSAAQAGAGTQYSLQGRDSAPCLDRWNVERFGLRTIATTDNRGASGYNPGPPLDYCKMDGNFGFGGTSAAAAQVAGVVALMLTANPNLKRHPEEVKRILCKTAETAGKQFLKPEAKRGRGLLTEVEKHQRFEQEFGAGLVDAAAAVEAAKRWPETSSKLEPGSA